MSSSEDADSESSGPSFQSAQPQNDYEIESEGSLGPSSDELLEDAFDPPALGARPQSDHSSESENQGQAQSATEQTETSSEPKDVTPSIKSRASSTRPNKYHGPPSTWRDWTAAERQIVASLDQLRAKDLSAHLYNFYYLKRRTDSTQEWQGETDPDTDEYVSTSRRRKAWLPVKTWTAWPMDPKAVPRESEESTWEAFPHELLDTEKTP
ncbi:MAG: hypothetical protein Q9205_006557, partial [Flavoplaca limonia]